VTELENTSEFVKFLTVAAVCSILGVSRPSVHALVRRGDLRAVRVGNVVRIPTTSLESFLIERGLNPSDIYRGTGQTATASPSPAGTTNANHTADAGAIVR
jgi:excisionase family DNA binding protein